MQDIKKTNFKKLIQYILGLLILTLGLSLMIITDLGPTSWDAVSIGLSTTFNFSIGLGTIISGILLVVFVALIKKEIPNIYPIIASIITGIFIDFWLSIYSYVSIELDIFFIRIIISFIGLIIASIGVNIYVKANLYPNSIDYFMVTLNEKYKIPFTFAKLLTDLLGISIALLLGGPVGIFTIVTMLLFSVFIGFFEKTYYRLFEKNTLYKSEIKKT